jgi:hypothetical protein
VLNRLFHSSLVGKRAVGDLPARGRIGQLIPTISLARKIFGDHQVIMLNRGEMGKRRLVTCGRRACTA